MLVSKPAYGLEVVANLVLYEVDGECRLPCTPFVILSAEQFREKLLEFGEFLRCHGKDWRLRRVKGVDVSDRHLFSVLHGQIHGKLCIHDLVNFRLHIVLSWRYVRNCTHRKIRTGSSVHSDILGRTIALHVSSFSPMDLDILITITLTRLMSPRLDMQAVTSSAITPSGSLIPRIGRPPFSFRRTSSSTRP